MLNLILFILISAGLTDILVSGTILNKIRPHYSFFHCPQCMGTWVGFVIFLLFWISGIKLFPNVYIGTVLFGFLSSITSNFLCSIFDDFGIKISKHVQ